MEYIQTHESLKDTILGDYRDPRLRMSENDQERERNIQAKDGEIGAKMNFEGLSGHTVKDKA